MSKVKRVGNGRFIQIGDVLVRLDTICDIRDWKSVPFATTTEHLTAAERSAPKTGILFVGRTSWVAYAVSYEDLLSLLVQ